MTATNHVLTGAVIATTMHQPILVIPLAFVSHFAIDTLPHFGFEKHNAKGFLIFLAADFGLASAVLLSILLLQPVHWLLILVAGITAASPDLMWLQPWLRELANKPAGEFGIFRRFHQKIQWGERPWGIFVEITYAGLMLLVLAKTLVI